MFSSNTSQVADDKLFVEDCFSTYLYQGNGGTQTITNGIDLAGKGGLVWIKSRSAAYSNVLFDTIRGAGYKLQTDATNAQSYNSNSLTAFNSNGFGVGGGAWTGISPDPYASWTFRKAPKFFDVVTYTGNGSTQSISHNLGTAPGTIIVKSYGAGGSWIVYHQSLGAGSRLFLNATNAATTTVPETVWGNNTTTVAPTSTAFTTGSALNANGDTYVAYLFAHDTTSDGIIQCGSYTGTGAVGNFVNLGWEPQWVLIKDATYADDWYIYDNMRGASLTRQSWLWTNSTSAEGTSANNGPSFGATGFTAQSTSRVNNAGSTYVYIAIRRGPMRTPTSGTSVFSPALQASSTTPQTKNYGFVTDALISMIRDQTGYNNAFWDRLRGANARVSSNSTNAESSANTDAVIGFDSNVGVRLGADGGQWVQNGGNWVHYAFTRAPSFFDEVCYTGTGSTTIPHNLGVAPEMMIVKSRSAINDWYVYSASIGATKALRLNVNGTPLTTSAWWNNTAPTSTVFTVGSDAGVSGSGTTFVAYLFASCPGVSKVGSYTGNGSSQTINCGFVAGARFVMIKRTDSTGDWYVWDSARGIVSGNDPRLSLNSTAAEVTTDDSVDTDSSGFVVNQLSATNINVSSATYIYLAVA